MNPSTSSSPDSDNSAQALLELNGIDSAWLSAELNRIRSLRKQVSDVRAAMSNPAPA